MKIYIAHSSKWNYIDMLYNPIKKSNIVNQNEVIFPHENNEENTNSKEVIKQADLVIAEVSLPTTGLGIELGWAESFGTNILCIYKQGYTYTSALRVITNNFIEYIDELDMVNKINEFLKDIKN